MRTSLKAKVDPCSPCVKHGTPVTPTIATLARIGHVAAASEPPFTAGEILRRAEGVPNPDPAAAARALVERVAAVARAAGEALAVLAGDPADAARLTRIESAIYSATAALQEEGAACTIIIAAAVGADVLTYKTGETVRTCPSETGGGIICGAIVPRGAKLCHVCAAEAGR